MTGAAQRHGFGERVRAARRLVYLSARIVAGRLFWLAPLLVLIWPAFQLFRLVVGWRPNAFTPAEAQGLLIGFPLTVLAVGLGVRIIAGELDKRTLEIAYTVPGGTQRVWLAKLAAAVMILLVSEALLAAATLVLTSYPPGGLYGALQGAIFYLVLAMAMAALFKSEVTGAFVTAALLIFNLILSSPLGRLSAFWNPAAQVAIDPGDLLARTVQNRIGYALVIAAVTALAFARAERREKLLSG